MTPTLSALHDLLTAVAAHPDSALHQALSALRATLPAEALEHATTADAIAAALRPLSAPFFSGSVRFPGASESGRKRIAWIFQQLWSMTHR